MRVSDKDLKERKLLYRLFGWEENANRHRCGNHWTHPDFPGAEFSIYEVAKILDSKLIKKALRKKKNLVV